MKIVAVMSWYDEPEAALTAAVRSLAGVADMLIAYDGAFAAFPGSDDRPTSDAAEYATIGQAALDIGIDLVFGGYRAGLPWPGNEVEKRARLMEHGAREADGGWVFVIDGDERVAKQTGDWRAQLDATELYVAEVEFRDLEDSIVKARRFFRAADGLTVEGMHYRYLTGDGRLLWGNLNEPQEPTLDLSDQFAMVHLPMRPEARTERRRAYYRRRNDEQLEVPPCRCGEPAVMWVAADLKAAGRDKIDAGWRPVCKSCELEAVREVVAQGRSLRLGKDALMMLARRRGQI